ncbi:Na+/H+ antiporter NhaC family protein [Lactobacillus sp. ESL0791]|uniref:Na+/H+ antiporter NhaC family protein n=1 Tax=Lactobacillus sp. ESL0791 TaxID=2983234 RepID=UPI0023F73DD7|nr:Na+/H+ antiporter NhaC family protein [Lactobacillus sp. ESL0791]MDF7639660.1 Na+/H+ antiporter NhaC family protein [Lactobacillus sp. ESL0791]
MNESRSEKNYKGWAFIPLLIFLILYVGIGIFFTIKGAENPFDMMPRCVAAAAAIGFALLCYDRKTATDKKITIYTKGAGREGVMTLALIVLLAGGFQAAAEKIGAQSAIVNMGINYIPQHFLVPGIFIIAVIISTCTGTSLGTQVTVIPVAVALANSAHLNVAMAGAAAIAGAYFGDSTSFISSTLICAVSEVNAKIKNVVKYDILTVMPAFILTIILYALVSGNGSTIETIHRGYNLLNILPYAIIIVASIIGLSVVYTLMLGIISTGVIGIINGNISFFELTKSVGSGMEKMYFLVVFSCLISGLIQLIEYYGGIDWLVNTMQSKVKTSKGCEYLITFLTAFISGSTLNNTVAVIITAPIADRLRKIYYISSTRVASLLTVLASAILSLIPYDSSVLLAGQYGNVSYLDLMKYSYYPVLVIVVVIVMIQFGIGNKKSDSK